jgi:hypothetical protein
MHFNKDSNNLKRLLLILCVGLISCDFKSKTQETLVVVDNDTTILHTDTTTILGEKYKAVFRTVRFLYVIKSNRDTVLKEPDLFYQFEFIDFNQDGNKDLLISYVSNIPVKDLLLFDSVGKKFKKVKNFTKYPEPEPITGTRYYYSYHRMGCADMNWDSDLFYIDNFDTHCVGNISGRQCEGEKPGIFINQVTGDSRKLIETLSIETIDKYSNGKQGLIKEYWTKNYDKFK